MGLLWYLSCQAARHCLGQWEGLLLSVLLCWSCLIIIRGLQHSGIKIRIADGVNRSKGVEHLHLCYLTFPDCEKKISEVHWEKWQVNESCCSSSGFLESVRIFNAGVCVSACVYVK